MEEAWWGGAERAGKGKSLRQLRLAGWVKAQGEAGEAGHSLA